VQVAAELRSVDFGIDIGAGSSLGREIASGSLGSWITEPAVGNVF
jgi:hypothetical protein